MSAITRERTVVIETDEEEHCEQSPSDKMIVVICRDKDNSCETNNKSASEGSAEKMASLCNCRTLFQDEHVSE